MATCTVGYWDVRGLAEPIRYLLHFKNVLFEDKRYPTNSDAWQKEKFTLGLSFPNLPYYIDKDVKLTQSSTILRYLAEKYDLDGSTEEQKLRVSLVEQEVSDFRMRFNRFCNDKEFEKLKPEFVNNVPQQLLLLSKFLGENKFLAGEKVTYVDFIAYDTFDFYRLFIPKVLDGFPNLKAYQDRMRNLPELQSYFQSGSYKRWPIIGPRAHFGGSGEEPKFE